MLNRFHITTSDRSLKSSVRLAVTSLCTVALLAAGSWVNVRGKAVFAQGTQRNCLVSSNPVADYSKIQDALSDATCQNIAIAAGNYPERLTIARDVFIYGGDSDAPPYNAIIGSTSAQRIAGPLLTILRGTVQIQSLVFTGSGGSAVGYGEGALKNVGGDVSLNLVTFANNLGIAITHLNRTGTMTITNSNIRDTIGSDYGGIGGIKNEGRMWIEASSVVNNKGWGGGGITNEATGALTVTNSTIAGNSSNSNIPVPGGGIVNVGRAWIRYSTIVSNTSSNLLVSSPNTFVENSIIANGICTGNGASLINLGHNIDSSGTCFGQPAIDPKLASSGLQSNLYGTLAFDLQADSPAIDTANAATCPDHDQGGQFRPQGAGCDIGAVEFVPPEPPTPIAPTPTPAPTTTPVPTPGAVQTFIVNSAADGVDVTPSDSLCQTSANQCTLRAAIMQANANPSVDSIQFAANLSGVPIVLTQHDANASGAATDDLDIVYGVNIVGNGASATLVDGNSANRIFHIYYGIGVQISGLTLRNGNDALNGGALFNEGTTVLTAVDVLRSTAAYSGGGILNTGTLSIQGGRFADNSSAYGGAISNSGTLSVDKATLTHNRALANFDFYDLAGGILNRRKLTVTNSTFSDNTIAISNYYAVALTVTNSTFARNINPYAENTFNPAQLDIVGTDGDVTLNSSTLDSGFHYVDRAYEQDRSINIVNSIITNHCEVWQVVATVRNSFIQDNQDSPNKCGAINGINGNIVGVSPELGALGDYGGPTLTFVPLTGSPVINAGNATDCPPTDQRGIARPQGAACDMGAVELTGNTTSTTGNNLVVFNDAPASGWVDWSSGVTNTNTTSPVRAGRTALAIQTQAPYGTVSFRTQVLLDATRYTSLDFWVYGGPNGNALAAFVQSGDSATPSDYVFLTTSANAWQHIVIPLSAFGNLATIKRINIQDVSGQINNSYTLDLLELTPRQTGTNAPDLVIYEDALAIGWQSWSYNLAANFASTSTVRSGTSAIRAQITQPYGTLALRNNTVLAAAAYQALEFDVYSSTPTRTLGVYIQSGDATAPSQFVFVNTQPGAWQTVRIPLGVFGSVSNIKRVNIQDAGGQIGHALFFDNVRLVGATAAGGLAPQRDATDGLFVLSLSARATHAGNALTWRLQGTEASMVRVYRSANGDWAQAQLVGAGKAADNFVDAQANASDAYWLKATLNTGEEIGVGPIYPTGASSATQVFLPLVQR